MYVCLCHAVSDTEIEQAVAEGSESLQDIQLHLGAATGCGSCVEHAQAVIDAALAAKLGYAA